MSPSAIDVPDPVALRPLLHAEVDRLSDEHLALAHRMLLEIELHQLTAGLDAAKGVSILTPESIAGAVAEHRKRHPYCS